MTTQTNPITIKALRGSGGLIEWNYDSSRQCSWFWRKLCETGAAPDTGDLLASACYFVGDEINPRHRWDRPSGGQS